MAEQLDNPIDGRGAAWSEALAAHTPGPWVVCEDTAFVRTADGHPLAGVYPGNGDYPDCGHPISAANARLVAAAPEMWETLCFYAARDTYNATGGYARPIDRDLGRRAQQALGIYVNPFQAEAADPPALISQEAAREMLAALRRIAASVEHQGNCPTPDGHEHCAALARAAIARAEGR